MDAEKLFIAMGYKLLPNQTLVLDGPICPDQVTNVSRDALTAFVECQIMKQVNTELATMGLATGWLDIFNFRECHIGDSSQSVKGLSQILQSHHSHMMRKGKAAAILGSSSCNLTRLYYFNLFIVSSAHFRSICFAHTAFATTSFILTPSLSAAAPDSDVYLTLQHPSIQSQSSATSTASELVLQSVRLPASTAALLDAHAEQFPASKRLLPATAEPSTLEITRPVRRQNASEREHPPSTVIRSQLQDEFALVSVADASAVRLHRLYRI